MFLTSICIAGDLIYLRQFIYRSLRFRSPQLALSMRIISTFSFEIPHHWTRLKCLHVQRRKVLSSLFGVWKLKRLLIVMKVSRMSKKISLHQMMMLLLRWLSSLGRIPTFSNSWVDSSREKKQRMLNLSNVDQNIPHRVLPTGNRLLSIPRKKLRHSMISNPPKLGVYPR